MQTIANLTPEDLKKIIKESVREVIQGKEIHYILHSLPEISNEEMQDISREYGSPDQYNDAAFTEKLDL